MVKGSSVKTPKQLVIFVKNVPKIVDASREMYLRFETNVVLEQEGRRTVKNPLIKPLFLS